MINFFAAVFDPRCGTGWEYDIMSGNCYLFRPTDYKNWDDARMECKLGGGELLSIADSTEQIYINGGCNTRIGGMETNRKKK